MTARVDFRLVRMGIFRPMIIRAKDDAIWVDKNQKEVSGESFPPVDLNKIGLLKEGDEFFPACEFVGRLFDEIHQGGRKMTYSSSGETLTVVLEGDLPEKPYLSYYGPMDGLPRSPSRRSSGARTRSPKGEGAKGELPVRQPVRKSRRQRVKRNKHSSDAKVKKSRGGARLQARS